MTRVKRTLQINIDFSSLAYAGEYVMFEYDYTYGGTSRVALNEPAWAIQDSEGTEYSVNFDVTLSYEIPTAAQRSKDDGPAQTSRRPKA